MKPMRQGIAVIIWMVLLAGCAQQESASAPPPSISSGKFYDLKALVDGLIADYSARGLRVNKRVTLNGNTETLNGMEINWAREFRPILEGHINRSSWQDKFTTDTLKAADGSYSVLYQSTSRAIPVSRLQIGFLPDGSTATIDIRTTRKNLLYNSQQDIHLEPGKRYSIEGTQRALFLSRTRFAVEGEILANEGT